MTLGERLTALRNQHGLSQSELAEKLNVSRQSVSKWETDTSIPELDKLIQLSEQFDITLDALVKGETPQATKDVFGPTAAEPSAPEHPHSSGHTRTIIGVILLCFGALVWVILMVLGDVLSGLLFASPFLLCGAVCLIFRKNTGLWCVWVLFFAVNLYLRYATGITWRLTLLTLQYESSMNYVRLAFAWAELLCFLALFVITVLRFYKTPLSLSRRGIWLFVGGWLIFVLLFVPLRPDPQTIFSTLRYLLLDWFKFGLLTILVTTTLRLLKTLNRSGSKENG